MKLQHTPLLLALLPFIAPAWAGVDDDASYKVTRLAPVRAQADDGDNTRDAGTDGWGNRARHDTPAALDIVGRQSIDDRQIRTLSELARENASLGDNYAPVGYYQNIAIRGYALDLGTGYRFNNLAMTGEQRIAMEDKQQVEVLKGLAGVTAGIMAPGGMLNFISKRPEEVRSLTLGGDSEGSLYSALDAGTWLTPHVGVRLNMAWEDVQSFVKHADGHRQFYSLAADWKPSERTTLELDTSYHSSAQRSAPGYQLLGGNQLPQDVDISQLLGYQSWQKPVSIHTTNTSARFLHVFDNDWTLRTAIGSSRSVIDDYAAFAYGCWYVSACWSDSPPSTFAPDGSYDIYDYRNPDDTRVADSGRVTLQGVIDTGRIQHELSIGASTLHRKITRHFHVNDYIGTGNIDDSIVPDFSPSPKQIGPRVRRLSSKQDAVFVMDRLTLSEHWDVVLGAHHAKLREQARNKRGELERTSRLSKTLPQAAVLWKPESALTVYASYAEGLALGKEAPSWTSNDGEFLAPRLSTQWEIGSKYRWQQFDLDATLFRIQQPYQYAKPDSSSAGFTFVQQGKEVHDGIELSANGRVHEALHLQASLAYVRAQAHATGTAAIEGHQVVNVPRLRSTLHVDYALHPQLSLLAGWRYAASNPATADGSISVDAYHVFDAGLRFRGQVHQHDVEVVLGVDNLGNRFYWRDTGSSQGDHYLFPGTPRLTRLSVRVAL